MRCKERQPRGRLRLIARVLTLDPCVIGPSRPLPQLADEGEVAGEAIGLGDAENCPIVLGLGLGERLVPFDPVLVAGAALLLRIRGQQQDPALLGDEPLDDIALRIEAEGLLLGADPEVCNEITRS